MKNRLTQILIIVLLNSVQISFAQEKGGVSLDRLDRLEQFVKKEIDKGQIPGVASYVFRKGELVYREAWGYRDVDNQKPLRTDDIFFIQSMTKPIISVAFMMLYEEGHFQLTDPVEKYLPAFKDLRVIVDSETGINGETVPLVRPVTIRHLLSHSAGFSHGLGASKLDREIMQAMYMQPHQTVQERVATLLTLPLMGQPGEQWYYSAAPDVLSVLIEQFSGMTTEQFLQERIFGPLGMKDTGYNLPAEKHDRVVKVHNVNGEGKLINSDRQMPMSGNTLFSGVNALFSTVDDYGKFCRMLLNNGEWNGQHLLGRKTIELMTSNHVGELYPKRDDGSDSGLGFGLGFAVVKNVGNTQAPNSVGNYFWAGAYCTYFFIDPSEEMVVILMSQLQPFSTFYAGILGQLVYQAIVD